MLKLHQDTPNCSVFTARASDNQTPLFRTLLPEWVRARGLEYDHFYHIIPGTWKNTKRGTRGVFSVEALEVTCDIQTLEDAIEVELTFKNIGEATIEDMWTDVCSGVNFLPGDPGWSNRRFIPPSIPEDRDLQGRYWFQYITPTRLFALTESGPVIMHPLPDNPDPDSVPKYSFNPSKEADARACYVRSLDGRAYHFQTWRTPCRWCTPCPGSACMHLNPFVTEVLRPGESASIRGQIGIFEGDEKSLIARIDEFQNGAGQPNE